MRHLAALASFAALGLTACGEDPDATSDDPAATTAHGTDVEVDEDIDPDGDADVEVVEAPDIGDIDVGFLDEDGEEIDQA